MPYKHQFGWLTREAFSLDDILSSSQNSRSASSSRESLTSGTIFLLSLILRTNHRSPKNPPINKAKPPTTMRRICHPSSTILSTALRRMTAERALAMLLAVICIFCVQRMSLESVWPFSSILFMQPRSRFVTLSVSMKSPLNCTIVWPVYSQGISCPLCAEFCREYPAKVQYSFMALPSSTGVAKSKKPYLSSLPSNLDLYLTAKKSPLSAERASQLPYLQKTRLMKMLKATPDWLRQRMNSQVWNLSKTASTDSQSLAEEREAKVSTTVAYEGICMWLYPNLAIRLIF